MKKLLQQGWLPYYNKAFVERTVQGIKIIIPTFTKLVELLADALS